MTYTIDFIPLKIGRFTMAKITKFFPKIILSLYDLIFHSLTYDMIQDDNKNVQEGRLLAW